MKTKTAKQSKPKKRANVVVNDDLLNDRPILNPTDDESNEKAAALFKLIGVFRHFHWAFIDDVADVFRPDSMAKACKSLMAEGRHKVCRFILESVDEYRKACNVGDNMQEDILITIDGHRLYHPDDALTS